MRKLSSSRSKPYSVPARKASARPKRSSKQTRRELQEKVLEQISYGSDLCEELNRNFTEKQTPELELLIKLFRVLILKLSVQANAEPGQARLASDLVRPVLEWARLEEKRKEREFAEKKYRDQLAAADKATPGATGENGLKPETLRRIERELKLF